MEVVMQQFLQRLRKSVLPASFEISCAEIDFEEPDIPAIVAEAAGADCKDCYIDTFESGFLASCALALWFMEFDEDNWFSFNDIQSAASELFMSRVKLKESIHLHMVKGEFPPMMLDLPVLLDYREKKAFVLSGRLQD